MIQCVSSAECFVPETGVDATASGHRDNPERGRKNHRITSGTLEALMH